MGIKDQAEEYWERLKKMATGSHATTIPQIDVVNYRGYGTQHSAVFRGRVLSGTKITANHTDSHWRNLLNTYRRFESDELPDAHLQIRYGEQQWNTQSDTEGYFRVATTTPITATSNSNTEWHTYQVALNGIAQQPLSEALITQGELLIPPKSAQYGIISDIDDTVLYTGVVSKTLMLYHTFFKNAYSRLAFPGVAALYWALHKGSTDQAHNPIFYVSNGPWNLYDMLSDFMGINYLPKGPILLRDFGMRNNSDHVLSYQDHKFNEIVQILNTYPHLKFVLIGDSGEKDTDIYRRIAHLFPKRISIIYIRNVQDHSRAERIKQIIEREDHVELQLIDDSEAIARHAFAQNLISLQGLNAVKSSMYSRNTSLLSDYLTEDD